MSNKFKYFFFAIIASLVFSSCEKGQPTSGDAVFKAHINGGAGMTILVKDLDPLNIHTDTIKADGSGTFVFTKNMSSPDYVSIIMVQAQASFALFLHPGDTLFMEAQLQNINQSRKFSGNAAIYNNYLTSYLNSSNAFQKRIRPVFMQSEEAAVIVIDSLREANLKTFDELKVNNADLDPKFVKFEQARILYEWALLHNIYPMYHRYYTRMSDFNVSPEYVNYLAECSINDTSLLPLDMYRIFLTTYVGYKMEDYYSNEALMDEQPSAILYRLNLIDKIFSSDRIKELMAYETVKGHIKQRGVEEYDTYYELYKKLCHNEALLAETDAMLADQLHLRAGAPAYNFSFQDIDGNKVSMSDFKGKYVYVDVWATWCNPCLAEIPYLKKLEEDFHEKNIVFISISVDKTQEPWRAMLKSDHLQGVQLWAGLAPEFSQYYKIEGIPRFMLFDREGNIINVKADRPSGEIEKQLSALEGI